MPIGDEVVGTGTGPGTGSGTGTSTPLATTAESPPAPALARAVMPFRVAYNVVLGEPMENGRLSFAGLGGVTRSIATGGLVALVAMLVSIVVNEAWRSGGLVDVGTTAYPAAVPEALVPVTFVAFFVAWLLIVWGAYAAAIWARLVVALFFAVLNAVLAHPEVLPVSSALSIRWSPGLALVAYAVVPATLVLAPEARRWPAFNRYFRPATLGVLTLATALFFGADLWAQVGQVNAGSPLTVPGLLGLAIVNINALLIPMVFFSVLAIVELGYSVTEAITGPFWDLPPWAAKLSLLALSALKLWQEIGTRTHAWYVFVRQREGAVVRTLAALVLLGALAVAAKRLRPRARASEEMQERVVYSASFVLALPIVGSLAVYGVEQFVLSNFETTRQHLFMTLPGDWASISSPLFWGAALVAGALLLLRSRRGQSTLREAAIGLTMVAVWAEYFFVPEAFGREWGFNPELFDAALTVCVAAYVLAHFRTIETKTTVWLGALVGFSWLVSTQGDLISLLGRLAGLPGALLLAVGLGYSLLTDSEFARRASRSLPAGTRPLLWVGYLLFAATIVNWVLAVHGPNPIDAPTTKAFEFIGFPVAAWFLSWRPFARSRAFEQDEQA